MRKILLTVILAFLGSSLSAQVSFGPKIGYNTSKLSVDKSDIKTGLKNSLLFGAYVRLGNKYYVQPELVWMTQGGVFKNETGEMSPFKQEVKLKTIMIPLLVGVKLADFKVANLRIMAGPAASIIANKEIESDKWSGYIEPIKEADIQDIIWSFQVGAGVDVLMFALDIKYNLGFNQIIKDVEIEGVKTTFASKTSGFNVSLAWKIF